MREWRRQYAFRIHQREYSKRNIFLGRFTTKPFLQLRQFIEYILVCIYISRQPGCPKNNGKRSAHACSVRGPTNNHNSGNLPHIEPSFKNKSAQKWFAIAQNVHTGVHFICDRYIYSCRGRFDLKLVMCAIWYNRYVPQYIFARIARIRFAMSVPAHTRHKC